MANMTTVATMRLMSESGQIRRPVDSLMGDLSRPLMTGMPGGYVGTLETLMDFFLQDCPDPDTALAQDPNFDEKVRQHPDVAACMRKRELTVAAMPARFEPSSHTKADKQKSSQVAEYCNDVFDQMANVTDLYRMMQAAVLMGGVGVEFMWAADGNGVERPVAFQKRDKTRFRFDRMGNLCLLSREYPVWGAYVSPAPVVHSLPDGNKIFKALGGKFVYHKYFAEGGPWHRPAEEGYQYWGRGEDTNLYIPVTFDQFVLRFRMKWLETYGNPPRILYYPDNDPIGNDVIAIAKSLRGESVILIPRPAGEGTENSWYKVDTLQVQTAGYDAFERFSDNWTKPRIEKILLNAAGTMDMAGAGAYSAHVSMEESGPTLVFKFDARNISETIDQQLTPFVVQAAFPGLPRECYPKHTMTFEAQKDRVTQLEVLTSLAAMVPVKKSSFYAAAGEDEPAKDASNPDEDEETVFTGQPEGDPFAAFGGRQPPQKPLGERIAANKMSEVQRRDPIGATVGNNAVANQPVGERSNG